MAFFDDMTEQEIRQNKAIRGYIVRALAKGNQNSLLVRQVTNALLADNLITVPDISKQLSYLEDGGYIEFTDKRATAYNAYRRDAVIQLTKAGVDLVEGTREDPGVDVYERIKVGYKQALRGQRKYTREAVKYDLFREKNNVDLWRELKSSKYTPGPYHFTVITEPKRRDLSIPKLRDKVVQLVIHEELQNMFRPVFINGSFACQYGRGPIRAAFKVQHDMRVARMKWGDDVAVIKIDARKFFYSIDRDLLKKILAKRFKKLKKKRPDMYGDLLRFYRLLCKVIDSSPEGERGIPLGNVSSQDFANIYLNELDQFCVRFLGAKLYTRYMDDIVIIAPSKEIAREWLAKIKEFLRVRLHLDTNKKTKVFYMRQGVNAYGFKIKATHLMLRTESKRREKRRIKAMVRKLREGKITRAAVVQAVNSWLGFARWASAYNLAKKIFAPYRFIKTEGAIPYGAISRNRQARRLLQQRRNPQAAHKAVA